MNEISWGLAGVVTTLAGIIVKMALHTRDLNKQIETIQNARIAQADQCATEKSKIYKEWMASDGKIRDEHRTEMRERDAKQQELLLWINRTLDKFRNDHDEEGGGNA